MSCCLSIPSTLTNHITQRSPGGTNAYLKSTLQMCCMFPFLCQWLLSKHTTSSVWLCWSQTVWPVAMETNSKQTAGVCRFQNIIMRILCCWTVCLSARTPSVSRSFYCFCCSLTRGNISKYFYSLYTNPKLGTFLNAFVCLCEQFQYFVVLMCRQRSGQQLYL